MVPVFPLVSAIVDKGFTGQYPLMPCGWECTTEMFCFVLLCSPDFSHKFRRPPNYLRSGGDQGTDRHRDKLFLAALSEADP